MKRREKLVISGNEFYIIDLDCLERKQKHAKSSAEKELPSPSMQSPTRQRKTNK